MGAVAAEPWKIRGPRRPPVQRAAIAGNVVAADHTAQHKSSSALARIESKFRGLRFGLGAARLSRPQTGWTYRWSSGVRFESDAGPGREFGGCGADQCGRGCGLRF